MAKRKTQLIPTKYRKKLLTAAGIFAAGSFVGSALEIPPMSAYFEITTPDSAEIAETVTPSPAPEETFQSLSAETEAPYIPPETEAQIPPSPVTPAAPLPETKPEETVPEAVPAPEPPAVQWQEPVPEPSAPAVTPKEDSDWMEGIFIPASPLPETPVPESPALWEDDWMASLWPEPEPDPAPSVSTPSSPDTSSMTDELAVMLENIAVFWSNADNKIHLDPTCPGASVLFAGTVEEAQTVRNAGWCRRCAEHLDGTDNTTFYIKGNPYASVEAVAASYSYGDYQQGIPADAFGG